MFKYIFIKVSSMVSSCVSLSPKKSNNKRIRSMWENVKKIKRGLLYEKSSKKIERLNDYISYYELSKL